MIFLDTLPKASYQLLFVAVGVFVVCADFVSCILIVWWHLV